MDDLCRDLPLLDHPRLRHNPATAVALRGLLTQNVGLTVICGGAAPQRTFVLTAMGHEFSRVDRRHRTPGGLDVNESGWFVPVETVCHVKNSYRTGDTAQAVKKIWPDLRASKQPLLLLNGVWSLMPELRSDIVELATRAHVIFTTETPAQCTEALKGTSGPVHILKVSTARENPSWLSVQVERG